MKMRWMFACLTTLTLLEGCSTPLHEPWQDKLYDLKQGKIQKVRIIQIGDSHTAADLFSYAVRKRLQSYFGNGGIGLIAPVNISGQQNISVHQVSTGWQRFVNRAASKQKPPFGGIMAVAKEPDSETEIFPYHLNPYLQNIHVFFKANTPKDKLVFKDKERSVSFHPTNENWQFTQFKGYLPFSISANTGTSLGQIELENQKRGILYSNLGVNGAKLSSLTKWQSNWTTTLKQLHPDLIVLAFGTNEAFNPQMDIHKETQNWQKQLQKIRHDLPNTSIILVQAPPMNLDKSQCKVPTTLQAIWEMQKNIAEKYHLRLWSWRNAMGGKCGMYQFQQQGMASQDGVHLNFKGYMKTGTAFANYLIHLAHPQK